MKIQVTVEDAGPNWAASSNDKVLSGTVAATAPTRDEALEKFRSALQFHVDGLREDGNDVPEITGFEVRELVAA